LMQGNLPFYVANVCKIAASFPYACPQFDVTKWTEECNESAQNPNYQWKSGRISVSNNCWGRDEYARTDDVSNHI